MKITRKKKTNKLENVRLSSKPVTVAESTSLKSEYFKGRNAVIKVLREELDLVSEGKKSTAELIADIADRIHAMARSAENRGIALGIRSAIKAIESGTLLCNLKRAGNPRVSRRSRVAVPKHQLTVTLGKKDLQIPCEARSVSVIGVMLTLPRKKVLKQNKTTRKSVLRFQ